jgi:hypothetical protein
MIVATPAPAENRPPATVRIGDRSRVVGVEAPERRGELVRGLGGRPAFAASGGPA